MGLSGSALVRAFASGGNSISQLALGGDDSSVDDLGDGITATRLIPDLHMIPGLWKIDGHSYDRQARKQVCLAGREELFRVSLRLAT